MCTVCDLKGYLEKEQTQLQKIGIYSQIPYNCAKDSKVKFTIYQSNYLYFYDIHVVPDKGQASQNKSFNVY